VKTLTELLAGVQRGGSIDLTGEQFRGTQLRVPDGISITGGLPQGETTLLGPVGFHWDGPRCQGDDVPTSGVLSVLGGSDWTVRNPVIVGGRAYGQLRVGLDLDKIRENKHVPMRWMIDGGSAEANRADATHPFQNHALYVITNSDIDMKAVIRNFRFGPQDPACGPVVKLGGTGGDPANEGACGVALEDVVIDSGDFKGDFRDEVPTIVLQGRKTTNVTLRRVLHVSKGGLRGMIRVNDGAQLRGEQCVLPGRTFVKGYGPLWLRWFGYNPETTVLTGAPAPGVSWIA
jgi:hypothetical protein